MSWLSQSLAVSLRLHDGDEVDIQNDSVASPPYEKKPEHDHEEDKTQSESRGVQEDLTEIKQTLTRQLWGVANFLAPSPDLHRNQLEVDQAEPSGNPDSGFGSDRNEQESNQQAANEESEESEDEEDDDDDYDENESVVGLTDEVLTFASNIAMHPETWLDFPLDPDEDLDDFDMSEAQRDHALAIERLSPRLAALRIELCPCHLSSSYFWKVYFVLLHSRLNKNDALMLSSPQVMEARALWMQELHKQTKPDTDWYGSSNSKEDHIPSSSIYAPPEYLSPRIYAFEPPSLKTADYEMINDLDENADIRFIDKEVVEEKPIPETGEEEITVGPSSKVQVPNYEDDDDDDWPEDDSDYGDYVRPPICLGNEEDISFSDLEDDDFGYIPLKSTTETDTKGSES